MNKKRNKNKIKKPFYKRRGLYLSLLVFFLLGCLLAILVFQIYISPFRERALTEYDYSKVDDVEIPSKIFDRNGEIIGRSYEENRSLVTIEQMPSVLVNALLAQEDQRFYEHKGVDWVGVLRAVWLNVKAGETTQGASTITMQLARNAFNLQNEADERGESGIERKIVESFVSLEIEKEYVGDVKGDERRKRKRKLLEMYLNRVHFGKGYYGVRAASLGFFGKEPEDLSLSECASMVACIKNPYWINPISNPERNQKDRNHVFTRMLAEGTITSRDEYNRLCETPVQTNPRPLRRGTSHLYEKVVSLTREIVGDDAMSRGGFSIYTTVDKKVQEEANKNLREKLLAIEQTEGYDHPLLSQHKRESNKAPKYLQGAVLVTDCDTGAVLAHVGGREFLHSSYDFIESGRRPTGTAFLPVVYAAAFERDRSPATLLDDLPMSAREVALGGSSGILGEWGAETRTPIYESKITGEKALQEHKITSRKALRDSKIAATVRLGVDVGITSVAAQAKSFGLPLESGEMLARLLLGWEQNSLWQMTRMYSSFSRNGKAPNSPYYIERIIDVNGEEIYRAPRSKAETSNLCNSSTAYQLHSILSDTGNKGNLVGRTDNLIEKDLIAVKTGTNHNFSDSWTLGYNGTVTCGVWVGFLEGRKPIYNLAFAKDLALPIWSQTMNTVANQFPGKRLSPPSTVSEISLCSRSGRKTTRYCYENVFDPNLGASLASTAYTEYLKVDEIAVGLCPLHGEGGVPSSDEFAPDPNEMRKRNLAATPITVLATALLGNDPYNSQVPKAAPEEDGDEQPEAETQATIFVPRASKRGQKEARIRLRPPPRIQVSEKL